MSGIKIQFWTLWSAWHTDEWSDCQHEITALCTRRRETRWRETAGSSKRRTSFWPSSPRWNRASLQRFGRHPLAALVANYILTRLKSSWNWTVNLNLMDCARTINIVFINLVIIVKKMVVFRIKLSQNLWLHSWYDYCCYNNVKCKIIYSHRGRPIRTIVLHVYLPLY